MHSVRNAPRIETSNNPRADYDVIQGMLIHRWKSYGEEPVVAGINSSTAIVFHSGTSAVSEVLIPD